MNRCYVRSVAKVFGEEPDLKGIVSPVVSRRLGRILKRAVATSFSALKDAGIKVPDAIITATGVGCMENSEKFLYDMLIHGEGALKPTLFMQSTHNTISSQIAILLKCNGYNNTYSHKGSSFAAALLDGLMHIENGSINNVLVGSFDEVTPFMAKVMRYTHPEFSKVTEGAVSALLTSSKSESICEIEDVEVLRHLTDEDLSRIVNANKGGLFYLGLNGNPLNDRGYTEILEEIGDKVKTVRYHEEYGDSFSSFAFGFYAAVMKLAENSGPERITVLDISDESLSIIRLKSIREGKDD
ncbi:MAG: beta-ketoacyl synthase chain length factor [Muribaculaceae bacterium]|nr:beta-ketoacyl synthase chain length factor [Muribaculaceae bacterium]